VGVRGRNFKINKEKGLTRRNKKQKGVRPLVK